MSNHTHGMSKSLVYSCWSKMKGRCTVPSDAKYADYGGRGISVCARWLEFENFYADMGNPPPGMSFDRIDVDGDYEPKNCRWATRKQQQRNRRANRIVSYQGRSKCLIEWSEETGINYATLVGRLRAGLPLDEVFSNENLKCGPRPRRVLTLGGQTKSVSEWARGAGISYSALSMRLWRGIPLERALSKNGGR